MSNTVTKSILSGRKNSSRGRPTRLPGAQGGPSTSQGHTSATQVLPGPSKPVESSTDSSSETSSNDSEASVTLKKIKKRRRKKQRIVSESSEEESVRKKPSVKDKHQNLEGVDYNRENYDVGDYVLVDFAGARTTKRNLYLGRIVESDTIPMDDEVEVTCLRPKKCDNGYIFVYPLSEDRSFVFKRQIVGGVDIPVQQRRGNLKFKANWKEWK